MAIECYPLEPDVPFTPASSKTKVVGPPPPPPKSQNVFEGETTECNYIVLVFVLGVLFLAFTDAMKK